VESKVVEIRRVEAAEAERLMKGMYLDETDMKTVEFCLFMSTHMWACFMHGKLAGIWGVIPPSLMSDQAYAWLNTTEALKGHEFVFIRHSQMVFDELLEEYPSVVGHVIIGADKAYRWLKWLGAEFGPPQGKVVPYRITKHDRKVYGHG
jgi:hypothetical protein